MRGSKTAGDMNSERFEIKLGNGVGKRLGLYAGARVAGERDSDRQRELQRDKEEVPDEHGSPMEGGLGSESKERVLVP